MANTEIIEPKEGYWLTQSSDVAERVFSKMVINPQEGKWVEWTDIQKTEWEDSHPIVEPNFEK